MNLRSKLALAVAGLVVFGLGACASDEGGSVAARDGGARLDGPAIATDGSAGSGGKGDGSMNAVDANPGTRSDTPASDGGPTGPDVPSAPICRPQGMCSPFEPGSCGAGKICRTSLTGTVCRAQSGTPKVEGDNCQNTEECGEGLICFDFGSGATCRRYCPAGTVGYCGPQGACALLIQNESCLRICSPLDKPCDIYDAQSCPAAGKKCGLARNPETEARYTGCIGAGAGKPGDPCNGDTECGRGTICIIVQGVSTCHEVCRPSDAVSRCTLPNQTCAGRSMRYDVTFCQ